MRAWQELPIVSGDNIGGHHEWGSSGASEPKVEDLESAVGPHHYVARLQVSGKVDMADVLHVGGGGSPVDDAGEVEVLDAAEHLVEQIWHSFMIQIHIDHLTEVGIH